VLRGHISVVMHLLRTATSLCHFYQRHLQNAAPPARAAAVRGKSPTGASAAGASPAAPSPSACPPAGVPCQPLLEVLMNYSIAFASQFIVEAKGLCQEMLKRYSNVGTMQLPVPRYRGFHVRPATLLAKIVQHYGSQVQMELDDESYDASSPIEIFRANERINAAKRWWLSREVSALAGVQEAPDNCDLESLVRRVVITLAAKGVLVIYRQPLELPPQPAAASGTVLQRIIQELSQLQATGKIDIAADLWARFSGDHRVLHEDNYGNNVELPRELTYLRQKE
jgi:hypothetical protein